MTDNWYALEQPANSEADDLQWIRQEEMRLRHRAEDRAADNDRKARAAWTREVGKRAKAKLTEEWGEDLLARFVGAALKHWSRLDYAVENPGYRKNSRKSLSLGHNSPLTAATVMRHLARMPYRTLFYSSAMARHGEGVAVHLAIDIDNRHHLPNEQSSEATDCAQNIAALLDKAGIAYFLQPSTNDCGYHLHLVLLVPDRNKDRIYEILANLRSAIGIRFADSGCGEVCLKGLPCRIRQEVEDIKYGTLMRAPMPTCQDDAESLLQMLQSPVPIRVLHRALGLGQVANQEKAQDNSQQTTGRNTTGYVQGGQTALSPPEPAFASPAIAPLTWDSLQHQADPNKRMILAALLCKQVKGTLPTPEALVREYEDHGLHTPANDSPATPQQRVRNAERALDYLSRFPDASLLPSAQTYARRWTDAIKRMSLPKSTLTYARGRRIRPEHLGLVMGIIDRRIDQGLAGVPKTLLVEGSRYLADRGEWPVRLDNKIIAHCRRVLFDLGLLKIDVGPMYGRATYYMRGEKYSMTQNAPLQQTQSSNSARSGSETPPNNTVPDSAEPAKQPMTKMQKRHAVKDRVFKTLLEIESKEADQSSA